MHTTERKMLVAGNWKMNGDLQLVAEMSKSLQRDWENVDVLVCPPFPFLSAFQPSHFAIGAQDVSAENKGAHTGEVSTDILKQFSCDYVIVGHSERREQQGENAQLLAAKVKQSIEHGLTPIYCIGESEQIRESGQLFDFLAQQLDAVLNTLTTDMLGQCVIAYEPIWAIGTGKTASPEQAQEVHSFIRQHLAKVDADVAAKMRILYGGSVNAGNAEVLFSQTDVDGGLVGGASLKPEEFLTICQVANEKR